MITTQKLTGARLEGVSGAQHGTAGLHSVQALPDHGKDRAREHVTDHTREEGLLAEVSVVCAQMLSIDAAIVYSDTELTLLEMHFGGRGELGGDELEAAFLEAGGDLANETAVNTIGLEDNALSSVDDHLEAMDDYLDHDVGTLTNVGGHVCVVLSERAER